MFHLNIAVISVIFCIVHCAALTTEECPNVKTRLKSIKMGRNLRFPDNSNIVITVSLAKAFHTHVPSGWYMISDLDVLYPLPNTKFNPVSKVKLHHRQKREFWDRIVRSYDLNNMNGEECLLRSICEAQTNLATRGKSLVHDLLRVLFTVSLHGEFDKNSSINKFLQNPHFCDKARDCPFSLISFLLALNKS